MNTIPPTSDAARQHTLDGVPQGKGVLLKTTGEREIVQGPFNEDNLYTLLSCQYFTMVPALGGKLGQLEDKALLLMDEEGKMNSPTPNRLATEEVGDQVIGGALYGNVLVVHPQDLE